MVPIWYQWFGVDWGEVPARTEAGYATLDLEAALQSDNPAMGGPDADFYAFRLHVRASPELLKKINEHMKAVLDLISPSEKTSSEFGPDDQHVSLTLAFLPIKGRDVREP